MAVWPAQTVRSDWSRPQAAALSSRDHANDQDPQDLTVIGPNGSEVTVLKPGLGQVIVIAQAGVTVRGMRFDHATLLNVSDHYARFLSGKGEVTIATIVR